MIKGAFIVLSTIHMLNRLAAGLLCLGRCIGYTAIDSHDFTPKVVGFLAPFL